ncbi:MAG TPA: NAD-dependent epimerase/dehydratase family protein [Solirubrobacteraceae bacterium]|nr:NAD-dependent epimerase/dehydratase family protein [Solirubrobacteraceae bacterium]
MDPSAQAGQDTNLDLVTGAFSYSGAHIAERLLKDGREVRTLTFHPDRQHPLRDRVTAFPYRFDNAIELSRALEGVTTLYNTYWVRFEHGTATFAGAVANSRALFHAARRAGVRRIVHLSIANPSVDSPLPYYRGKALVEQSLAEAGLRFSVVRPTWIFGGGPEILANNIAWILRHLPVFAIPGDGSYQVQPVHIDDLARICVQAAGAEDDMIIDAAGPETISFAQLVHAMRRATGSRAPIVHVPPIVMTAAARALGLVLGDVVLTGDEVKGLTAGLLVSHDPPLGRIAFTDWLNDHSAAIGHTYANEFNRHFSPSADA